MLNTQCSMILGEKMRYIWENCRSDLNLMISNNRTRLAVGPTGRWIGLLAVVCFDFCVYGAQGLDTRTVINGNTVFAFELYGRIKAHPGNIIFSPFSISSCLAMAYAGARDETATQIARTLHF